MIEVMGLEAYSTTQQSPDGLRAAGRFVPPADHASLLSPNVGSPAAFFEMQKQAATFIGSFGGAVVVTDESTMVPEVSVEQQAIANLTERKSSKSAKGKKSGRFYTKDTVNRLEQVKNANQADRFE
jgi:hypothetical protein